jgi:protein-S-isoprenylcysteine O-methyltransferase Ste14
VNTFAANVRVEKGQKVISRGVYGFVRDPMYFAALLFLLARHLRLDRGGHCFCFR